MALFSLKWLSLSILIFASIILYNYVFLHELLGSFSHAVFWVTDVDTYSEPFHLSPSRHVYRRPEPRRYEMVLRTEVRWPDGVQKTVITVNGKRVNSVQNPSRQYDTLLLPQGNFRDRLLKSVPATRLKSL
jgi:hypothetical protein